MVAEHGGGRREPIVDSRRAPLRDRLARLSDVKKALVLARLANKRGNGSAPARRDAAIGDDTRLVAYWTGAEAGRDASDALRAYLRERLPEHMVPDRIVHLDRLPRTATGKLDRRRLPAPSEPETPAAASASPENSAVTATIETLWCRALKIPEVRADDDFFELGGHSLLGVSLVAELEDALEFEIGLAALFEAPRFEDFVALVARRQPQQPRYIFPISNQGSEPPLHCVHWGTYAVQDDRRPLFGLFHQLDSADPSDGSIDGIAEKYLQDIRRVQPHGPYYLAGCSAGGLIALEIARRLAADGEQVGPIALVDPTPRINVWKLRYRLLRQLSILLERDGLAAKLRYLADEIPAIVARRWSARRRSHPSDDASRVAPTSAPPCGGDVGESAPAPVQQDLKDPAVIAAENEQHYSRIALAHDLRPLAIPVVLFLPGQARLMRNELIASWRDVVPNLLDVQFVDGAHIHLDFFQPAPVRRVLTRLAELHCVQGHAG